MSVHDHEANTLKVLNRTFLHNRKKPIKRTQLKGREAHCLMCLMLRRNSTTFLCNPSRKTIGKDMQCAKSTVHTAISGLVEKGYIVVTRDTDDDGYDISNQYWIMAEFWTIKAAMEDDDAISHIEDKAFTNVRKLFYKEFGDQI